MSVNLKKAIKDIKKAGFTHFKVELEANLHRREYEDENRYEDCTECDGRGFLHLFTSTGVEVDETTECTDCYGEGKVENEHTDYGDEGVCENFIRDFISPEARAAINYMNFYNDGSVDSEITFTLPIDEPKYAIEMIEAFNALAEAIGLGCDVEGAGMHVSVMAGSDYPTRTMLPSDKLMNFTNEVSKLIPVLFVAATSGDFTRGLNYREPQVSHSTKYSAIYTHGGTCLEYRLFETCYQRPEALYEYLGTIARTLEYYTDATKKVTYGNKKAAKASIGAQYPIYSQKGLKGFTELPEQIDVIKQQFKHVKPEGITMKEFMEHRGIKLNITDAKRTQAMKTIKVRKAYKEHIKAYEFNRKITLTPYQEDNIAYYKREYRSWTDDQIWAKVTGFPILPDEATFIKNNTNNANSPYRTISV